MAGWTIQADGADAVLADADAVPNAAAKQDELPLLVHETFADGADRWNPTDSTVWKLVEADGGQVYQLHTRKGSFKPPHRSPLTFALLKEPAVGDFELTVKVRSTVKEYGHRDVCLFFDYQDPAHFYYVHFASKADPHANQIFIVDGSDRKKITVDESKGVKWTGNWQTLRIVRRVIDGTIEAYFDNMEKPIMTASDKTFLSGKIGIGSFDDTADFAEVTLRGNVAPDQK